MKKIFEEVQLNDGRRINVLKDILQDHLLAYVCVHLECAGRFLSCLLLVREKSLLINSLRLIDDSLETVKQIDRERDVQLFLQSSELCPDEHGKNVYDYQPKSEGRLLSSRKDQG